ncbi:MAG TPA: glycosyltransferase family 4 protein [Coleofasciculaceae cyanobacterium]
MRKPVLTIFYQFNPWQASIGGIQTIIRSFVKYAPDEFDVRLVGIGSDPTQSLGCWQDAEFAGRAIRFMPLFTLKNDNVRQLIPTTIKYTAALMGRHFESDFMHFHRIEPTLSALKWTGEKTLFVHNDIQQQVNSNDNKDTILWRRFPAAYFALENILVRQFDQIYSCNTSSLHYYQQRYPEIAHRVAYIRNTFDNEIYYPLTLEKREQGRQALAQRMSLADDTRFVLFAGRLHAQKDPVLLVKSFATLNEPNVHLLIVGEGNLKNELLSEIRSSGLSEKVTMLGALTQGELAQLHRVCSVFVLTSAYEGLPLVVLEALACGTPVVTTRCGETPNFLSPRSGIVCQERTPSAVADALRRVLHYPEDYPMEACIQVTEPYSASKVVGNVYNNCIERYMDSLTT